MRVAIVGPGAMGCLFGALLSEAGHPVWLLGRSADQVEPIARTGIRVEGIGGARTIRARATTAVAEIGPADLVFIWVKAYDTASAVQAMTPVLTPETLVVSLQNGLGNLEAMARAVPPAQIVGGVTAHGATLLGAGVTRHAGQGATTIGRPDGRVDGALEQLAELLSAARVETSTSPNIEAAIWSKLAVNAAINPLTALARRPNGDLLRHPDTRQLVDRVAAEVAQIATAAGMALSPAQVREQVHAVCQATAANKSSMLQDVLRGRRTEIDAINGALADRAAALGLDAPLNELLTRLVRAAEVT